MSEAYTRNRGFTLIELSIVLVIIGLIISGILVGQDLISAAATRAQITQIEKFNTAANTFVTKFSYLPGDIPDPYASQFGFQARGQYAGEGDGNGVIEGVSADTSDGNGGQYQDAGETVVFWGDLSQSGLIPGTFTTASSNTLYSSTTNINAILPQAVIGNAASVLVWSRDNVNHFAVENVNLISPSITYGNSAALTVSQARNIDVKIDDGLPMSGNVTAELVWPAITGVAWTTAYPYVDTGPAGLQPYPEPGTPSTCVDNGNTDTIDYVYSTNQSGNGLNCALSFKMQGAAR